MKGKKKNGRGIVDVADRFMTRWHRGEAEKSWQRLTAKDAKKSSNQGKPGGARGGSTTVTAVLILLLYVRDECRNEVADRVARWYQFD